MSYGRVYTSTAMEKPKARSARSDEHGGAIGSVDLNPDLDVCCYSASAAREIAEAFLDLARQMEIIEQRAADATNGQRP